MVSLTTPHRCRLAAAALATLSALVATADAQSTTAAGSCAASVSSSVPAPSVAPGFESRLVAAGLKSPRGIQFDSAGNLLVVEQGGGVVALNFTDYGGSCLQEKQRWTVVNNTAVSAFGLTLVAMFRLS